MTSVFECEHLVEDGKKGFKWIKEKFYYIGNFSETDLASDWRFKEVPGKRKQLILIEILNIG